MEIAILPVGPLQANCYILSDSEKNAVVVDPGGDAPRILEEIRKRSLRVQYILLTHVHFDHFLAAAEVRKAAGAPLLVPKEDADALADPRRSLVNMLPAAGTIPTPDRLLTEGEQIGEGELSLTVLAAPGHTPGSVCYRGDGILLTGDTLFAGGVGRTDFPGGDETALRHSLRRLSNLEGEYTVLPGHGPETSLETERRTNPYMG